MNILIVDDVDANLISLEALLENIDNEFKIIKAHGGNEALELALKGDIDLMVLDIQMPDIDGFEVAKLLKSNNVTQDIPIIFLTAAFKTDEWSHKGFEVGAVDYLTKPIDENQFVNRIKLYAKLIRTIKENRYKDKILAESSKLAAMGEMIGNIAHQWRQPLSIISTASTGMKMQKEFGMLSDEFFYESCDSINENAQYLSKTIDDFKNFIKGESKAVNFNLKNDTDAFLKLVDGTIKNNHIKIILDLNEDINVNGYPSELIQCLINIFNNSKDALIANNPEDNRIIFISQYIKNNQIKIIFKDNAGGIPNDILPKIFEPYFTTKHQSVGTGLGLHMTYNLIVEGMNGDIKASNVEYDFDGKFYKGSEFVITLPIAS